MLDADGEWSCRTQSTIPTIHTKILNVDFVMARYRYPVPRHGQTAFISDNDLIGNCDYFRIDHGESMLAPICIGHVYHHQPKWLTDLNCSEPCATLAVHDYKHFVR
jgi:hypothetical protein